MSYTPDKWTDKELEALERRIAVVYREAEKDLDNEVKEYFGKFRIRDKEMKDLVDAGEMSNAEYMKWRTTQIGRGKRYEALRDKVAERYTKANEVANAYVNDLTPSIYSLNRNYEAYTIEKTVGNCDFTLWDESTVRRLLVEQPDLMPYYPAKRALNRGIDLAYGKDQITKRVTSGIIRGLSPGKIASELMVGITSMNRESAVRAARTGITTAENAGRLDSWIEAEKMGIQIKRRWMCTKDGRSRTSHGKADGQTVTGTKEPFEVGGYKMMFPGDRSLGAPGSEIYNCRCTTRTVEKDGIEAEPRQMRVRDPDTGKTVLVNEMTYAEWAKWKKNSGNSGATSSDGVILTPKKSNDANYNRLLAGLNAFDVEYNPVMNHTAKLTDDEIINALSGGDKTKGSCASVGLAYIGQKQGWAVLDFRDGESRRMFSGSSFLKSLSEMTGMQALTAEGASSLTVGNRLLKMCEEGKEYYLAVGRHAAIVRKNADGVLQYLELQSKNRSGWTNFDGNPRYTLKNRFGCTQRATNSAHQDFMLDLTESDFTSNDDFRSLLGFLNTEASAQRKGIDGTIK